MYHIFDNGIWEFSIREFKIYKPSQLQMKLKKKLNQIREGNYSALVDAIEMLLDLYNEDKYELGYRSFLDDLDVHADRITQELFAKASGAKNSQLEEEETKEIIIKYFTNL